MASPTYNVAAMSASRIASYSTSPSAADYDTDVTQAAHRIDLANFWTLPVGSTVLDIGCGQGLCTAVLAKAVGATGSVDAIDPGSPDYGSPLTLSQAQAIVSGSAVGERITWHYANTPDFLAKHPDKTWDCAVLCHCIWYLDTPEDLVKTLTALRNRVKRVLIAEYALAATSSAAVPHLLTAIARATHEAHNPDSTANIRCLIGPKAIAQAAKSAGWSLKSEKTFVPHKGLQDGIWEVRMLLKKLDMETVASTAAPRVATLLDSLVEMATNSAHEVGLDQIRTMDVWAATFE